MDIPIVRGQAPRSSYFIKFVECIFAAIAVFNIAVMYLQALPRSILTKLSPTFFAVLLIAELVVGISMGVAYSIYWHITEKDNRINSPRLHAWLRGILRYWLAMEIATYGWAKIFKTQFAVSYLRNDTPVGQLSGFELTWNYFGYSYALAVIIALLQIGGAILLLFRRTTLLGVAVLLPVMVNIVLINLFYHIAAGAFLNSILFTLGLTYLLSLRRKELVKVFLPAGSDLPEIRLGFFKWLLRLLAIGAAFGFLFLLVARNPYSSLAGKWKVEQLIRNRDTVKAGAWVTDSSAWTNVYIEERVVLALCPNPFVYEPKRSTLMNYIYDSVRHDLKLIVPKNRKDTAYFQVSHYDGRSLQWNGILVGDTLQLRLSRVEK